MNLGILLLDLRLRRRTVIGTAIGTAVYLLLVVAVFPTFTHDTAFDDVIRSNPTAAAAFGINGFVIGPVVAAMFIAVWHIHGVTRSGAVP